MKELIVNGKRTVFIFTVMFLLYGITSLGSADDGNNPHFHDESTTRTVPENAAVGTNVGDPVSAHSLPQGTHPITGELPYRYTLSGSDTASFNLDNRTGQLTIATALGEAGSSYSVTVGIEIAILKGFALLGYLDIDSIDVTITVGESEDPSDTTAEADALQTVSSEERSRIAAALAMDRVIFNEFRNATTNTHDWVELRNISNADVTLDGWQAHIVTDEGTSIVTFPAGTVLPAGGLLLLLNTDPDAPEMPLSSPDGNVVSFVDAGLILPQTNFTLLLRSSAAWEDSVGNYFFGYEIPPTAPPLTTDAAWYRARPDALGYQAEAWVASGYQDGVGYDVGVPAASALGTPGHSQTSLTGDVNGDGIVNIQDLVFVASRFDAPDATEADLNKDGIVNIQDLVLVSNAFGRVMDTR